MEIEVKARLRDPDAVLAKIAALRCALSEPVTQHDTVWAERFENMEAFLSNKVFLRIREQDGMKIILTAKQSKTSGTDADLVKREHEVVVDSSSEASAILEMLGLQEIIQTIKTRRKTVYKNYEICIDDVQGLGVFIELEQIAAEEDAPVIQKEMRDFLATLGVAADDVVMKGYDILQLEAKQ